MFLGPPRHEWVQALVGRNSGFYPVHPFHTGSGDHVNAAHLVDCALQAAHLLHPDRKAGQTLGCVGVSAEFYRFVELDHPFLIRQVAASEAEGDRKSFEFTQNDRLAARVELRLG